MIIEAIKMEIKRDYYRNKLIAKKHNSLIKVVTGMRRCGKSYLLFTLFKKNIVAFYCVFASQMAHRLAWQRMQGQPCSLYPICGQMQKQVHELFKKTLTFL